MGIEPKANNGTLRLPLKPVGLHSDSPEEPTPADEPSLPLDPEVPDEPIKPTEPSSTDIATDQNTDAEVSSDEQAVGDEEQTAKEQAKKKMKQWWAYVVAKMKAAQAWANKVVASIKTNQEGKAEQENSKSLNAGKNS